MPSALSTPNAGQGNAKVTIPARARLVVGDAKARSAGKGAETLRRHREERRADSLAQIRDQIAAGTLFVRQMTAAEHTAASQVARRARARNQARHAQHSRPSHR
jgi:hypothetical protein